MSRNEHSTNSLHRQRRQAGFMIALVAVLLVALGMVAAVVVADKDRAATWDPRNATRADLSDIQQAVVDFQRSPAHRLPCPASLTADTGAEVANCDTTTPPGTVDAGTVIIGALPTKTLGLPDSAGEDQWGNKLTYAVVRTHTNTFTFSNPLTSGGITVNTSAGTLNNKGYVILSHGQDGKGALTAKSTVTTPGKPCTSSAGVDQANCDNDLTFNAVGLNTTAGASYFDDLIQYKTIDATAQSTNIPCPNGMATSWSGGGVILGTGSCSGAALNEAGGGLLNGASTSAAIVNTAAGVTGSATLTCNNGTLNATAGSCYRHCTMPLPAQSWLTNCSGTPAAPINHGNTSTLVNTAAGYTGSVTLSCTDGTLSQIAPISCAVITPLVNGVCGGSGGTCSAGTVAGDNGATACGTTRSWSCNGSGGGTNASCSLANPACVVNGVCSDEGCLAGTVAGDNGATACGTTRIWSCNGSGGGTNASCSLANPVCVVNGACNSSVGGACLAGTVAGDNGATACGTTRIWSCNGSGGGTNASCSRNNPACVVNGACNSSEGVACTAGTVAGDNGATACGTTRIWSCNGSGGGTNASCSLANPVCVVNGACNSSVGGACTAGTVAGDNGATACGTTRIWSCNGSGGGTNASCSLANPACVVNGDCNNGTDWACWSGISANGNVGTCGGNVTWQCLGQNGGTTDNCSRPREACPGPCSPGDCYNGDLGGLACEPTECTGNGDILTGNILGCRRMSCNNGVWEDAGPKSCIAMCW